MPHSKPTNIITEPLAKYLSTFHEISKVVAVKKLFCLRCRKLNVLQLFQKFIDLVKMSNNQLQNLRKISSFEVEIFHQHLMIFRYIDLKNTVFMHVIVAYLITSKLYKCAICLETYMDETKVHVQPILMKDFPLRVLKVLTDFDILNIVFELRFLLKHQCLQASK